MFSMSGEELWRRIGGEILSSYCISGSLSQLPRPQIAKKSTKKTVPNFACQKCSKLARFKNYGKTYGSYPLEK
jgi:hypothetical protein